jgi:type IV pilus assembly protein PilY1
MQTLRQATYRALARRLLTAGALIAACTGAAAQTVDLADRPMFSTNNVPGNLMLALSVEWPTANTPAYVSTAAYSSTTRYLGYFDPAKCYRYQYEVAAPTTSYFAPVGAATNATCTSSAGVHRWSGNYLNWAAMQSLDIFRWVLTGGDRAVDTTTDTQIEKTRHSGQGSRTGLYPDKVLSAGVAGATPFTTWNGVVSRVHGLGTAMYFSDRTAESCTFNTNNNRRTTFTCTSNAGANMSCHAGDNNPAAGGTANCNTNAANPARSMTCSVTRSAAGNTYTYSCNVTAAGNTHVATGTANYGGGAANANWAAPQTVVDYDGVSAPVAGTFYRAYIRVRACDATAGLESNCFAYGTNHKPQGLMQEYAMQLRFGAFGYLNDGNVQRDGGVLRARMKSIGPDSPVPGSTPTTNANAEWSASTGILNVNPDATDASDTTADTTTAGFTVTINNSGVINYLNRFGKLTTENYKSFDPVSEMYYAATRYFRNLGNVPAYTNLAGAGDAVTMARWVDGFPVIRQWNDPMQYSCQKNFILGIGDVYTHRDRNVPGSTITSADEPAVPAEITGDTTVNATTANNMVGQLEGLANLGTFSSGRNNSYYMAGLAYDAHVRDIRADLSGSQTINTYWLDVRENQTYESRNQYWLAAKYGGFDVPANFDPYAATNGTTTLTDGLWTRPGQTVGADQRPNNYFIASDAQALADGLRAAFARIASENSASTNNTFATVSPEVRGSSTVSYKASYTPANWSGNVEASELTFNQYGVPTKVVRWLAGSLLDAKAPSSRQIITCCTSTGAALPFQATNMAAATLNARATTGYQSFANVPGVPAASQSAANFINYLRGVRTLESTQAGGVYRSRASVLGDIVGSKITPVAAPQSSFLDQYNPGYASFRSTYATRKTVVYVGANDGMLHAFDGAATTAQSPTPGDELFAYIPSFVHSTSGTAPTDGLATLGDPNYLHRYFVNATPKAFDVDFFRTPSPTAVATDWRTVLIGGLGKGGRGYYALDITDPSAWTSETAVANRFLWEFSDSRMGLTFGDPIVAKTAKHGWTVLLPSGYNNGDGVGYLFLLNPRTGALLDVISTPEGSTTAAINMAHITAYTSNRADGTIDAVYGGDMRGNVWRFDLTAASGTYPAAEKIAQLTDSAGVGQPITTRVRVATDPQAPNKRFIVVGTGRLMADSDILDSQTQSLYVIADGTATQGGFYRTATLPSGVTFPVTRSMLNNNTSVTGIGANPPLVMGWYLDLPVENNIGARVDKDVDVQLGAVLAAANVPDGQPCSGGGTSRVYIRRLSNGQSALVEADANGQEQLVEYRSVSSLVNTVALINLNGRIIGLTGTNATGTTNNGGGSNVGGGGGGGGPPRCQEIDGEYVCTETRLGDALSGRLNWREVQTSN